MISPVQGDTICAIATPPGTGAIAIIRISGPEAITICDSVFSLKKKDFRLHKAESHTIHFGFIMNGEELLDEVLVSVFREPHSYTGENSIEISCHGSTYIQQKIVELLISKGARHAQPGEFTLRAFLNRKFDLSQAEAVADLIASNSRTAHDLAIDQMRGGFSKKISELRSKLLDFASLIELELDFSQEDVEFADRTELVRLLETIKAEISHLVSSFSYGNVLKTGIPVAIIGKPNVGKSTLLNAILNEERAIVSEIPGTTRDTIEDTIVVHNYAFRFIDTAGLRHSTDSIESEGIERTYEKIRQAKIVLYVFDVRDADLTPLTPQPPFPPLLEERGPGGEVILIANKADLLAETPAHLKDLLEEQCIFISAKRKENINLILERLVDVVKDMQIQDTAVVSNIRHYEALNGALQSIEAVLTGLSSGLSSDLITVDLRLALYHLGLITGEITTDDILGNIFGKFCIGK
jgi:tRNA modification GTPase